MITDGRFYVGLTGDQDGNAKYDKSLKKAIEDAGQLCCDVLESNDTNPIMLLGNIQSGKTRAFIGLIALCFDNDFDITFILTKSSKALVKQTVKRMMDEFGGFKNEYDTRADVVAQDILDLSFAGAETMEQKENIAAKFANRYVGKKRIIVVKKQQDNMDHLNLLIDALIAKCRYKKILVIDDEADITGIGYEKTSKNEVSLRRISGSLNAARKKMNGNVGHVLMQVTATPYALYLQPELFANDYIMSIKPKKTVVLPHSDAYVGGQYYFVDSSDENSKNYVKAKHLIEIVEQNEIDILNGTRKNSSKRTVINDGRTVKLDSIISGQKEKNTFVLPSLRQWLFDVLVGASFVLLNEKYKGMYLSAVLHASTKKDVQKSEGKVIQKMIEEMIYLCQNDLNDSDVRYFLQQSYDSMRQSCEAYGVLTVPSFHDVCSRVVSRDDFGLTGLLTQIEVKIVNSESDIERLLDENGELNLESELTIFVGGQVLDRGITIKNLINFFYGRDPGVLQQDTVMQHCRMFGYRGEHLLSVTRFYTSARLYECMKEITERDNLLRERMLLQPNAEVVYLDAGGNIKPCSPQKTLASNVNSILPDKRYLPVGFYIDKKIAKKQNAEIRALISSLNAFDVNQHYHKGNTTENMFTLISIEDAMRLIRYAYESLIPEWDGRNVELSAMEAVFNFSLSQNMRNGNRNIALIVREGREIGKYRKVGKYAQSGNLYIDAPEDGNNEGALASEIRKEYPVLVLIEEKNPEWESVFWWPVFYTSDQMSVGIYSESEAKTPVQENPFSYVKNAICIESYEIIDNYGFDESFISTLDEECSQICDFFNEHFENDDAIHNDQEYTNIVCPISLEKGVDESAFKKRLAKIILQVKKVLDVISISEKDMECIYGYFDKLSNGSIDDEYREKVIRILENKVVNLIDKKTLLSLIDAAEDEARRNNETLGYFVPTGTARCEIHLYMDSIKASLEELGFNDERALLSQTIIVMAHEIFHSLHFTDTISDSGRWLYRGREYGRHTIVKESLASYFMLCYAKKIGNRFGKVNNPEAIFRKMYLLEDFPKDQGYSGAYILENEECKGNIGNMCNLYKEMYCDSLADMMKAYTKLGDVWNKRKNN